jgi:hypothetical protein
MIHIISHCSTNDHSNIENRTSDNSWNNKFHSVLEFIEIFPPLNKYRYK